MITRKKGERIRIPTAAGEIVVTLVRTLGGKARIGIEAPPNVPVIREELPLHPRPGPEEDQQHVDDALDDVSDGEQGAGKRAA